MQPQKIDSIHDYLTPDKILHSLITSSNKKNQFNRSLTQQFQNNPQVNDPNSSFQNSTPRKQRESYKKKPNQGSVVYMDKFVMDNQEGKSQNFNKIDQNAEGGKSNSIKNASNSRISRVSQNSNKYEPITTPKSQFIMNSKKDQPPLYPDHSSNRKFLVPNKTNPDVARLAIQQTINKLILTRNSLTQQISQLKRILDDVSVSLQNMDAEFQLIKQKILTFTSKALDSAFREYKKTLPNWTLYEGVEQRGINKIAEINQAIQICQNQEKLMSFGGKQTMQNKAEQLALIVKQVRDAKEQCLAQRPMISQQKLKKLQNALKELGQF